MLAQAQSHFNVGEGGADLTQCPRPDEAPQPGGQGPVTPNRRERESKALAAAERGMLTELSDEDDLDFLMTAWADGEGDSDSGDEGWTVHRSVGGSLGR